MAERVDIIDIDLTKLQSEAEDTGKTLKDLKDEVKELKKSLDGATIGSEDFASKLDELSKKQDELKKITRTTGDTVAGSYNAISAEMSSLKKEWKATGDTAKRAQLGIRIAELNDQLKELDATIGNSQRNVGNYQSALEGLSEISLEDKIESSEKLAENMGHVARIGAGLSGVFEIVEGGMNLMGVESEKIEEAMIKIQSLMAITQGLSAIGDSVESFTKLSKAVKESEIWTKLFTKSKKEENAVIVANTAVQKANTVATKAGTVATKGLKKALISSGIGAIIVGIGVAVSALIDNWEKLTSVFNSGSKEMTLDLDKFKESLEDVNEEVDFQTQLMKIRGATEREALDLEKKTAEDNLELVQSQIKALEGKKRLKKKEKEQLAELKDLEKEYLDNIKKINNDIILEEARMEEENKKKEEQKKEKDRQSYEAEQTKLKNENERIKKENEAEIKRLGEELKKIRTSLLSSQEQEIFKLNEEEGKDLKNLKDSLDKKLITTEEYEKLKLDLTEKYAIKENEIIEKYNQEKLRKEKEVQDEIEKQKADNINKLAVSFQSKNDKLYASRLENITDNQDKNYLYQSGSAKLDFYKEQLDLLKEYKQSLIDLQATEEQLAEVDAQIAENKANQKLAEQEMWQGRLDGMNAILEATNNTANSILSVGEGLSTAWGNVFTSLQEGINKTGEALKKGEKGWKTYAQVIGSSISLASSVMNALADEQDASNEEGFDKQKKFQIAEVVMNTLAGVVSATTSAMSPVNAWMTLPGQIALAASTGAMITTLGALQINKIKKTQFDGNGGGEVSPAPAPAISAMDRLTKPVNYTSEVKGASEEEKVRDTKVYVTETDISRTMNNVKTTVNEATY